LGPSSGLPFGCVFVVVLVVSGVIAGMSSTAQRFNKQKPRACATNNNNGNSNDNDNNNDEEPI
jgi:hypothetical protein